MADWKQIPDTDVDPDAPVTSELMYALRDNPVAIAEGAEGAPRVKGIALDTFLATHTGSNVIQSNPVALVGLGRVGELLVSLSASGAGSATAPSLQVSFTSDNGDSWGQWITLTDYVVTTGAVQVRGNVFLFTISISEQTVTLLSKARADTTINNNSHVLSISTTPTVNGVRFRSSSTVSLGDVSVSLWAIGGVT